MPFVARELRSRDGAAPFLRARGAAGEGAWSWAEFWALVDGYRRVLATCSAPGEMVVLVAAAGAQPVAAFVAGIADGRLVTCFPPPHPIQDSQYYREQQRAALARVAPRRILAFDAGVARDVALAAPDFAPLLDCVAPPAPGDWQAARDAFAARIEGERWPELPLFVQHSSGTTGIKKAVAVSAAMLAAQFEGYWRGVVVPMAGEASLASWLPLYHDMGLVAATLMPVLGAAPLGVLDPFEWVAKPQLLLDAIEQDRPTLAWMPNFAFRHHVRLRPMLKRRDLSSVRAWVNCSEPCRAADAEAFEAAFGEWGVRAGSVRGCYAMAETVFAVSQDRGGERARLRAPRPLLPGEGVPAEWLLRDGAAEPADVLSSGTAIPGMDVAAWHAGQRLPEGAYGELGVRADCLFPGYRGMTAAESGLTPDGVYLTGDLGCVLGGEVFVLGRLKEVIIVNGKNLFAGDVEAAVGSVAGLKAGRAVAFGLANPRTGSEDLVVVAERDPALAAEEAALVEAVGALLEASFGVKPRDVRVVAERWLVKSTSGKISRAENQARYIDMIRQEGRGA